MDKNDDVGDGCWRVNVLMTTLRCCWKLFYKRRAVTFITCHQDPNSVTDFKSPTSGCHQQNCPLFSKPWDSLKGYRKSQYHMSECARFEF